MLFVTKKRFDSLKTQTLYYAKEKQDYYIRCLELEAILNKEREQNLKEVECYRQECIYLNKKLKESGL